MSGDPPMAIWSEIEAIWGVLRADSSVLMRCAKGLRFALRALWGLWRDMRTCGEVVGLARTADHLGFDALCRGLCKSASESYANHPVRVMQIVQ